MRQNGLICRLPWSSKQSDNGTPNLAMRGCVGCCVSGHAVDQCFSTGVLRNLRVPRMAARGFAEWDRNCLERNSQPQLYAVI